MSSTGSCSPSGCTSCSSNATIKGGDCIWKNICSLSPCTIVRNTFNQLTTTKGGLLALFFGIIPLTLLWGRSKCRVNIKPSERSNKVVVITGCDSGFGLMSAEALQKQGFVVVAACLTAEGCAKLQNKVALVVQTDVTKADSIANLRSQVDNLMAAHPTYKLWGLINNAGIGLGGNLDWLPMSDLRKVMEVNFFGVVECTRAFMELLKTTKHSRIVNISSLAGLLGGQGMSAYCASKHAVEGWAKSVRHELMPWNVHVCNINPGFMRTGIVDSARALGEKVFRAAPASVTDQYDYQEILDRQKLFDDTVVQEDPILVVDEISEIINDVDPSHHFNHYPGKAAKFMKYFVLLPTAFQDWMSFRKRKPFGPKPGVLERIQGK